MEKEVHLYKLIYNSIVSQVAMGSIKRKERLPSLGELSRQYGVGLGTVRKALQMLQESGYISVAKGKNAVVIYDRAVAKIPEDSMSLLLRRSDSMPDVYRALSILLPDLIVHSAALCSKEQLAALAKITKGLHEELLDTDNLSKSIYVYLSYLLSLLDNPLLSELYNQLNRYIQVPFLALLPKKRPFEKQLDGWLCQLNEYLLRKNWAELNRYIAWIYRQAGGMVKSYLRTLPSFHDGQPDKFDWTPYNGRHPMYGEIAQNLLWQINTGIYSDTSFLPSVAGLASEYGVSEITARKAIAILNKVGIAKSINGRGTCVVPNDDRPPLSAVGPELQGFLLKALYAMHILACTCKQVAGVALPHMPEAEIILLEEYLYSPDFFHTGKYTTLLLDHMIGCIPSPALSHVYRQLMLQTRWGCLYELSPNVDKKNTSFFLYCRRLIDSLKQQEYEQATLYLNKIMHVAFKRFRKHSLVLGIESAASLSLPKPSLPQRKPIVV